MNGPTHSRGASPLEAVHGADVPWTSPARDTRVCHVIHSLRDGGAEHLLVTLAEVAATAGVHVSVVSLMPVDGLRYARQLEELGVEVRSIALGSRWDVRGLPRAARLIGELDPDVLHTHLKHADFVGAFASRRLHVPMISTLHVIEDAPTPMQRVKRRLAAQARIRSAHRTITVSDAQRRWYLDQFGAPPDRVTTLRNGVLPPTFEANEGHAARFRHRLGITDQTTLIAMVALLRPGKGHHDLFDAVRLLSSDLDVTVILAGDGPTRKELETEVSRDPTLRGTIRFAGFVEDVEALLSACDLVVHPSHFDALPTALLYALAAGVPVVATRVGGISEILGEDAGVLVPAMDPPALAAAVEALVRSPEQRAQIGAAAHARFRREFDARAWVQQLQGLYAQVVAEYSAR